MRIRILAEHDDGTVDEMEFLNVVEHDSVWDREIEEYEPETDGFLTYYPSPTICSVTAHITIKGVSNTTGTIYRMTRHPKMS
jgi:hypothetical protein